MTRYPELEVRELPYTLSFLRLRDYRTWKSEFDSPEAATWRKESGQGSFWIFRAQEDPNEIALLIKWRDLGRARAHLDSPELAARHRRLLSAPAETRFLELLDSGVV